MSGMFTQISVNNGEMVVQNTQQCTPIAEHCKTAQAEGRHGSSEFRHAAKLPQVAVEAYMNQHAIDFREFMSNPVHIKRMCNDPDLRDFRIWPGRV